MSKTRLYKFAKKVYSLSGVPATHKTNNVLYNFLAYLSYFVANLQTLLEHICPST